MFITFQDIMPRKQIKWYEEVSLPLVSIRKRNGQLVIPIPKRSAVKHNLKANMEVHPIIFIRTKARHKGELKDDEVSFIAKKKDYNKFKQWKKREDDKIRLILKSLDKPEELTDEELELIRDSLSPETYKQLRKALKEQQSESQNEEYEELPEQQESEEESEEEKDYYDEYSNIH